MDPEALERGARALREINSSPNAKLVFDLMRRQEQSRQAEVAAEKAHYEAIQAQADIDRQRKLAEEQRNLLQQQAQTKAQMLRQEDELARKRMQTDHEAQRRHNVELVKMQEESSIRKEHARRASEEQIQAQQRQTEKERAEIERETIRVKAMAEAEGQAHEAKLTEEHNRRMLMERITREGARVTWGYINRILGQPSLIRESSIARNPLSGIISQARNQFMKYGTTAGAAALAHKNGFKDITGVFHSNCRLLHICYHAERYLKIGGYLSLFSSTSKF